MIIEPKGLTCDGCGAEARNYAGIGVPACDEGMPALTRSFEAPDGIERTSMKMEIRPRTEHLHGCS